MLPIGNILEFRGVRHDIRDGQFFNHIVDSPVRTKLEKTEIEWIAHALLGLAHLDKDFAEKAHGHGS